MFCVIYNDSSMANHFGTLLKNLQFSQNQLDLIIVFSSLKGTHNTKKT